MTLRIKMPKQIAEEIEAYHESTGVFNTLIEKKDHYELSVSAREFDVLLDFVVSYNADNRCRYQVLFMCDSWDEDVVIAELGVNWIEQ